MTKGYLSASWRAWTVRRSTIWTTWVWQCLCVQGVLMLTTVSACPATVAWWYWCLPWRWCKGKQNPRCSPGQAFFQSHKLCGLDGIRCRRSTERDQPMWMEKNHLRFRFPGPAGLRFQLRILLCNSGFLKALQDNNSRKSFQPSHFAVQFFLSPNQVPSLFFSFATGFTSWQISNHSG